MELQVGVKILLKDTKGRYLFVKRNNEKYPEVPPGWGIVGGRIIPGTPLIDNLRREIKEETDLQLTKIEKILTVQDLLKIPDKHVVRIVYIGRFKGKIKLDKKENSEYKWFSLKEIKNVPKKDLDEYSVELVSLLP